MAGRARLARWRRRVCSMALGAACALGASALAEPALDVRFVGMHGKQANLSIERRTYLLAPGESAVDRVIVLSVNRREAILGIDGVPYRFAKGAGSGVPLPTTVVLPRDPYGMFLTEGAINGRPVLFVVDTGATYVALSGERARELRIRYSRGDPIKITTASRVETAYRTRLQSVRVGGIIRLNVPAIITKGRQPDVVLLGMSFLSGLQISQTGGELTLIGP